MMGTEIFKIDASWAEKLTKTRLQFLLTPTVVLMSKLKNPRHTASRVRSKMVNALLQGNGTEIWMMYCCVLDNCFYHSAFSRLEEVESDGGQGNREEAAWCPPAPVETKHLVPRSCYPLPTTPN